MTKRSNRTVGSDGERAALEDLRPAFPGAERVKRADYGISDIDLVLDDDFGCEVKTGENYISKSYQKMLEQAAKYFDIRPALRYVLVWVQDRPGRGRTRTRHAVMEAQSFVDLMTEFKEMKDENSHLRKMVKDLGGAAALVAARAVARDNGGGT